MDRRSDPRRRGPVSGRDRSDPHRDESAARRLVRHRTAAPHPVDRPGVLALITGILSEEGIGISSVIQPEAQEEETVPLVLMLHAAPQGRMNRATEKIAALDCVKRPPQVLRVETFA